MLESTYNLLLSTEPAKYVRSTEVLVTCCLISWHEKTIHISQLLKTMSSQKYWKSNSVTTNELKLATYISTAHQHTLTKI